jgi:tetratricopeptide (TPR) repeat protein
LIIKLPQSLRKGERVAAPVELTDIAPTLAAPAGVDAQPKWTGVNVLDPKALAASGLALRRDVVPRIHLGWNELRSLIVGSHHYVEAPKPELYDLRLILPNGRTSWSEQRRVYASMRERMSKYASAIAAPSECRRRGGGEARGASATSARWKSAEGPLPDPEDHIGDLRVLQDANRLTAQGRHKEAAAMLRSTLSSNPRFTDAWAKLASIAEEMGQDEEALRAYSEGIKASPASAAEFALSMSGLYLKLNRVDEARKHAELALERNPAGAHQLLARAALQAGDLVAADRGERGDDR